MRHIPRRIPTPTERGFLKDEIRDLETQLNTPEMVGVNEWAPNTNIPQQYRSRTVAKLARLKKVLEEGSVEDLSRQAVNKDERRIKELEDSLRKKMVPRKLYFAKQADNPDYQKTVDHIAREEMGPDFQKQAQELKSLLRSRSQRDAKTANAVENPNVGNIEYLRP